MGVGAGFGMDENVVGTGFGELGEERVDRCDHQVDVEGQAGVAAEFGDDGSAEAHVGDEMTVHDVEMEPVGAGTLDGGDLVGEAGEIGREQARGDEGGAARARSG